MWDFQERWEPKLVKIVFTEFVFSSPVVVLPQTSLVLCWGAVSLKEIYPVAQHLMSGSK